MLSKHVNGKCEVNEEEAGKKGKCPCGAVFILQSGFFIALLI